MATWKKVIVSGSEGELNTLFTSSHITSSNAISGSGNWFGNLPSTDDQTTLVIYDTATGQFQKRALSTFPGAP